MEKVNKNSKQMVADVVEVILSEAQIRPLIDQIPVYFTDERISYIEPYVIYNILQKLQRDESVIKNIVCPPTLDIVDQEPIPTVDEEPEIYNTFYVEITPNFELWAENYLSIFFSLKSELGKDKEINNETEELKIVFNEKREILLNDLFLLAKPNFGSENELFFSYVYKNANINLSREKIEHGIGLSLTKKFHKIIENLGFNPDLKRCFFEVGKENILFRNPVTRDQLKKLGVEYIHIN